MLLHLLSAADTGGWPTCATVHNSKKHRNNTMTGRPAKNGMWTMPTCENAHVVDVPLAEHLSSTLFRGGSLLELGAGCGCYGARFEGASTPPSEMVLFDGTTNIDALTNGHVQPRDLSQPLSLGRKFDWVMSLEVGEHIPRQFEHTFISNIVNHATRGIVLSWAVVGQRGTGHVNTRSNAHIAAALAREGWAKDEQASQAARDVATMGWFKGSLGVYRRS